MSRRAITGRIATIALRHLQPQHVDAALANFKAYLGTIPAEKLDAMSQEQQAQLTDRFMQGAAVGAPDTAAIVDEVPWQPVQRAVEERPEHWRAESAEFQRASGFRWNT